MHVVGLMDAMGPSGIGEKSESPPCKGAHLEGGGMQIEVMYLGPRMLGQA